MASDIKSFFDLMQDMLAQLVNFANNVVSFLQSTPSQLLDNEVIDEILVVLGLDALILETPVLSLILGSGITFVLIYSLVRWAIP